jgi:hypothetical protein
MTAEIAVMNRDAIALAADSAVTFQDEKGQKIFTSASKIFTLSKYQPVGVMIYGSASFMGIPWETIIKIYRNGLGQKTFKTVGEYAEHFRTFLAKEEQLFSGNQQDLYVKRSIYSYFWFIEEEITKKVEEVIEEKGEIDEIATEEITSQIVKKHFENWKEPKLLPSVPEGFTNDLRQKYRSLIRTAKKEVFEKLPLTQRSSRQLTEIAVNLFVKFPTGLTDSDTSGVVIAGFGTEDVFPVLESFSVECKIDNYLKHKKNEEECVKLTFPTNAAIRPFAQSEMVEAFMTGVDPDYQNVIDGYMGQICSSYPQVLVDNIDYLEEQEKEDLKNRLVGIGRNMFGEYTEALSAHRQEHYISPVMRVVKVLPKDELAAMAESLINLTSFKRRVSMEEETVGGPIDVAVISKGDGFIWIKRKHYFERELNQQFFANYYEENNTNVIKTTEKDD